MAMLAALGVRHYRVWPCLRAHLSPPLTGFGPTFTSPQAPPAMAGSLWSQGTLSRDPPPAVPPAWVPALLFFSFQTKCSHINLCFFNLIFYLFLFLWGFIFEGLSFSVLSQVLWEIHPYLSNLLTSLDSPKFLKDSFCVKKPFGVSPVPSVWLINGISLFFLAWMLECSISPPGISITSCPLWGLPSCWAHFLISGIVELTQQRAKI